MSGMPHEAQRPRLGPCPFCGGEAHASLAAYASGATAHVACDGCGAKVLGYGRGERGLRDAVKRWNRRTERTCHIKLSKTSVWHCDGCGQTIDGNCFADNGGRLTEYRYCPSCGARVEP